MAVTTATPVVVAATTTTTTTSSSSNGANGNTSRSISTSSASSTVRSTWSMMCQGLLAVGLLQVLYKVCYEAYSIRTYALQEYGLVIHEFDPYFNYRATEYLYEHGWYKFRTWFDTMVWYPLGRPVGTTIYPGMQVTSVWIKNYLLPDWSINDICCYVPTWFGVTATLAVAWLTYECTYAPPPSPSHPDTHTTILLDIPVLNTLYKLVLVPINTLLMTILYKVTGSTWGLPLPRSFAQQKHATTAATVVDWMTPACCATAAASIMSIVPAHLLRSVGGGYDNESIAMTAMVLTFACWVRSLRQSNYIPAVDPVIAATSKPTGPQKKKKNAKETTASGTPSSSSSSPTSWKDKILFEPILFGCMTGVAYFYMVAAWGGYVFVLNLIGVHAATLVLLQRYSSKLHRAYTAFYIVGTTLAIQVPVVGWTPLKSLEQMGPLAVFLGMQLLEGCHIYQERLYVKTGKRLSLVQRLELHLQVFVAAIVVALLAAFILFPKGYFGPVSSRVRGLFVEHTKTGNPLVDSVAEHQAANPEAYASYLSETVVFLAPIGLFLTAAAYWNDASSFLLVYAVAAYYFSHRMVRLILLTAPIASCLAGIVLGRAVAWVYHLALDTEPYLITVLLGKTEKQTSSQQDEQDSDESKKKSVATATMRKTSEPFYVRGVALLALYYGMQRGKPVWKGFYNKAQEIARQISHPTIIQKATTNDGKQVLLDDYREAYLWLKDNTPADARIMAWWDYGYQITGIANRTTIADGNTWNHEHIALLGRTLTAPEREGHRIARHLADYILLWTGGGGDDVAKSPHLRRIANSVYRGLCSEPTCREFGFYSTGQPTKDMMESLLFRLHSNGVQPGVEADRNRWREVYHTKYGKVRIYKILSVSKESKEWVAKNRKCDAPGSWFCPGQYPPALQKVLSEKKDFKQLEDFNVKGDADDEYTKQYMKNLMKDGVAPEQEDVDPVQAASRRKQQQQAQQKKRKPLEPLSREQIDKINEQWQNNPATTMLWEVISQNRKDHLIQLLTESPQLAHFRSEDGRGPMWWAYEYDRTEIIQLLKNLGVSDTERADANGIKPIDLKK